MNITNQQPSRLQSRQFSIRFTYFCFPIFCYFPQEIEYRSVPRGPLTGSLKVARWISLLILLNWLILVAICTISDDISILSEIHFSSKRSAGFAAGVAAWFLLPVGLVGVRLYFAIIAKLRARGTGPIKPNLDGLAEKHARGYDPAH